MLFWGTLAISTVGLVVCESNTDHICLLLSSTWAPKLCIFAGSHCLLMASFSPQVSEPEAVQCGYLPDLLPHRASQQGQQAALPHHGVLHPGMGLGWEGLGSERVPVDGSSLVMFRLVQPQKGIPL